MSQWRVNNGIILYFWALSVKDRDFTDEVQGPLLPFNMFLHLYVPMIWCQVGCENMVSRIYVVSFFSQVFHNGC